MKVHLDLGSVGEVDIEKPDHYSSGSVKRQQDKNQRAIAAIDRLTTSCRETVKDLYNSDFQELIGSIRWLEQQAMEARSKEL